MPTTATSSKRDQSCPAGQAWTPHGQGSEAVDHTRAEVSRAWTPIANAPMRCPKSSTASSRNSWTTELADLVRRDHRPTPKTRPTYHGLDESATDDLGKRVLLAKCSEIVVPAGELSQKR